MKIPLLIGLLAVTQIQAASFLIEAEQFADKGGWGLDTQFIESMGSSYLIAHGLGKPVADASTEFEVAEAGNIGFGCGRLIGPSAWTGRRVRVASKWR